MIDYDYTQAPITTGGWTPPMPRPEPRCPSSAPELGQIPDWLNRVSDALEDLESVAAYIVERISPVTRVVPQEPAIPVPAPQVVEPAVVPLARTLMDKQRRIVEVTRVLRRAVENLEL